MFDRFIHYFKSFDYPVSARSFAFFRILYSLYVLGLIYELNSEWPLLFDHIPPYSISLFPIKISLLIWFLSSLFLLTGFFTRFAAIINYILVLLMAVFFANSNIGSFNDDLLRIGGFLLIFLPV